MNIEVITQWQGIILTAIGAIVAIAIALPVAWRQIKNAYKSGSEDGVKAGVTFAGEAFNQEQLHSEDKEGIKKARDGIANIKAMVVNPNLPTIDSKINKVIETGGSAINLMNTAVSLLKIVSPKTFKR